MAQLLLLQLTCCFLALVSFGYAVKEPLVAPYVDVTRMTEDYLVKIHQSTGLSAVTLAFALGGTGGCEAPSWGGEEGGIANKKIIGAIKAFEKVGGKVIVATGGAMGPYLEASCSTPASLAAAYKKILNTVGSTHLDIDIEASISVDNMNAALKILQSQLPGLTVSFTLMIQGDDYGITDALGVTVLNSAAKHGVTVDIVNAMTMEFGSSKATWGEAVISAAEATHKQMKLVWPSKSDAELYSMLGVTPMLGRNFNGKVFQIADAKHLVSWAKEKHIGHLAFWSLGRDNGHCAGGGVSPDCSSISQGELEFTKIFQGYAGTKIPTHPTTDAPHTNAPGHHTTAPRTTKKPAPAHHEPIDCSVADRHYPHETDCDKYYWCYQGTSHLEHCGAGTVWDPAINACNFPGAAHRTDCH